MTTALCLNCGVTKFGAICPCAKCQVDSCGNQEIDIFFSDHYITVGSLKELGGIIKQINLACDDPKTSFFTFITYMSNHPADLLGATPPDDVADDVQRLLDELQLPIVDIQLKTPHRDAPPTVEVQLPESLLDAFLRENPIGSIDTFLRQNHIGPIKAIQVRLQDGRVIRGNLFEWEGALLTSLFTDDDVQGEQITAIRKAPGCLFGWLKPPRWIEREDGK